MVNDEHALATARENNRQATAAALIKLAIGAALDSDCAELFNRTIEDMDER